MTPSPFISDTCNSVRYRQAMDADHGAELWRTDGTTSGTVLVKDIFPGEESGAPIHLTPFGDYLYFQVSYSGEVLREGDVLKWRWHCRRRNQLNR